jgi:hypothetical protein
MAAFGAAMFWPPFLALVIGNDLEPRLDFEPQ